MTERHPTRQTTTGRAYLDLQNKARRERRPTDELDQSSTRSRGSWPDSLHRHKPTGSW